MVVLPKTTRDIGEHLSQLHTQEKKDNRQIFLKILQNVQFLALQIYHREVMMIVTATFSRY